MALKKTKGLIIKETDFGEYDKLVTIFSLNGKFKAVLKGVRSPRSRLKFARLFSWAEFEYFTGKNLAQIKDVNLIESFNQLTEDVILLSLASFACDLVDSFYQEEEVDKKALKLLVYYLYYLSKNKIEPLLLTISFIIKILYLIGFGFDLSKASNKNCYFNIETAQFSSKNTKSQYNYRLNPDQIKLLKLLFNKPINKIDNLTYNRDDLIKLFKLLNHFIAYHIKNIKSYRIVLDVLNT